jgi:DNA polymerase III subunit beta
MQLIKTSRDAILKPLSNCVGIVERKHTLPILANVLLRKEEDTLHFLATDVEIQITTQTFADTKGTCTTTVAARKLLEIIKALPEGNEVILNYDAKKLVIQSGKARFSVQTLEAVDFPTMTAPKEWTAEWSMSQKALKNALNQVSFSMAQQDIRYYLNGLLLSIEGQTLRTVATDGHRLAYCETHLGLDERTNKNNTVNLPKLELIIPRKTVLELLRQLDESEAIITIKATAQMIQFEFVGHTIMSKLIEGKFPDFNKVIPKNHSKVIDINRIILQSALQRAAIMTTDKFKGVKLALSTDALLISAHNADQEEAYDELDVLYQHEAMDIGFNVNYLLDVLANFKVETVQLHFSDTNASAMLTVLNDLSFKYVVMPMRI